MSIRLGGGCPTGGGLWARFYGALPYRVCRSRRSALFVIGRFCGWDCWRVLPLSSMRWLSVRAASGERRGSRHFRRRREQRLYPRA